MRRYALRDDQWNRIDDLLPGRAGSVGVTAADNRLFVEAVLFRYRAGIPWRDLPERFGDWKNVHRRFSRWAETSVWERVFQHLADDADNEYAMIVPRQSRWESPSRLSRYTMIDSTIVRAHQHSAGAQKKTGKTRRSGAHVVD
jgi:transposase